MSTMSQWFRADPNLEAQQQARLAAMTPAERQVAGQQGRWAQARAANENKSLFGGAGNALFGNQKTAANVQLLDQTAANADMAAAAQYRAQQQQIAAAMAAQAAQRSQAQQLALAQALAARSAASQAGIGSNRGLVANRAQAVGQQQAAQAQQQGLAEMLGAQRAVQSTYGGLAQQDAAQRGMAYEAALGNQRALTQAELQNAGITDEQAAATQQNAGRTLQLLATAGMYGAGSIGGATALGQAGNTMQGGGY